jgi:hypothetical protein
VLQALIVDPFWLSLKAAPLDDEEVTPEDIASLAEAEAEFRSGKLISHEEIKREFGIE